MARPHIFFIQSQNIPWQADFSKTWRADVETKVLSSDDETGAATLVVRYPAGWSRRDAEHVTVHEEIFVLDGSLEINGRSYGPHCYAFLPAGYPRTSGRSATGATVLTTLSARPVTAAGSAPQGFDPRLLVERLNTLEVEWDASLIDPKMQKGPAIKMLRTDPDTREVSLLFTAPPHRIPTGWARPRWTHPMIEEVFYVSGEEVWTDSGIIGPGGYMWWRENEWHGPSGSLTGFMVFVRTIGGPLENIFASEKTPFSLTTKYQPRLPGNLAALAREYRPFVNY